MRLDKINDWELGYARESKENVQALRNQVQLLRRSGCSRILADVESGTRDDRRFFNIALQLMKTGRYTTLKVPRLDRLSRVLETHMKISEEFRERGLKLVALDYGEIDISTPHGWQACITAATNAQLYVKQLSYNVKIGKAGSRQRQENLGGRRIFGYKVVKKRLQINRDEYKEARERIDLFCGGMSLSGICRHFADKGIRISHTGLRDWLLNPHIYGHTAYGRQKTMVDLAGLGIFKEIIYNTHDPIASQQEWDRVRFLMQEAKRRKGRSAKKPPMALSGLLFCQKCGYAMAISKNGKEHKIRHPSARVRPCDHKGILNYKVAMLEVNRAISDRANELIQEITRGEESTFNPILAEKRMELDRAIELQRSMNAPEIELMIDRLQKEIASVETGAKIIDERRAEKEELIMSLQDPEIFDEYTNAEKYEIYHDLVRRITIWNREIIEIKLNI